MKFIGGETLKKQLLESERMKNTGLSPRKSFEKFTETVRGKSLQMV